MRQDDNKRYTLFETGAPWIDMNGQYLGRHSYNPAIYVIGYGVCLFGE